MIVDSLIKGSSTNSQVRSPSSLKRIYDQLKQTYYNQLLHPKLQDNDEIKRVRKRSKQQIKKINKILPDIKKQQNLTTKQINKYLTYNQFFVKNQENLGADIDPVHSNSKSNNRQLKALIFPNRLNSLRLTRYLTKRKSQQPHFRQSQDIIITKRIHLLQSQRDTTNATETKIKSKKNSVSSPIKHFLIKKCIQKAKKVQLPIFISFEDFSTLIKQYQYIQVKQECFQYKAYIGKGNNSGLIKRLLKQKGYWNIVDKFTQDVHFVWTQTKNETILKSLKKRQFSSSQKYFEQQTNSKQINTQKNSQCYYSVSKILSQQMLDNIVKSKNVSKKININNLLTQIKSRRKNITTLNIDQNFTFVNHVDQSSSIGNKKGLLYHMTQYYSSIDKNPFQVIPQSIHLINKPSNLVDLKSIVTFGIPCILKPASGTNRGTGISIHTNWESLYSAIQQASNSKSFIIQRYLSPFLYKNRKFDIRVWVLWCNGQAWWYNQGYLRTSSKQYNLRTSNRFVHLTNDAVQKKSQDYGKYEAGNKLSFADFQKYLNQSNSKFNFSNAVSQMKSISKDVFRVSSSLMDKNHKTFGYELFGLDFMIDKDFKVWLIQANTNPCLQTSCSLLNRLITNMLEGVLNLTIDIVFPPPKRKIFKDWSITNFKFELLYDDNEIWNKTEQMKQIKFETDEQQYANDEQE